MTHIERVIDLVLKDSVRLKALEHVSELGLPHSYIAAGFIRNLVWDHLHQKAESTPLNDVDVIYFDLNETDANVHLEYERKLSKTMPQLNWQVRNQAMMHERNGDRPYKDVIDAMSYWPEKETAVAIRKIGNQDYECVSAFGFESLFQFKVTHNPKRALKIFEQRVVSKKWLVYWPNLVVSPSLGANRA